MRGAGGGSSGFRSRMKSGSARPRAPGTSERERQGVNAGFVRGRADLSRALGTGNQGQDETQTPEGRQTSAEPRPWPGPCGTRACSISRREPGQPCSHDSKG